MKAFACALFVFAATGYAYDDQMVEEPPATMDEQEIVVESPDPSEIDPELPITPPVTTRGLDGGTIGAVTTGICLENGEPSGALTREQCAESKGEWRETMDPPPQDVTIQDRGDEAKSDDDDEIEVPSDDLDKEDM